MSFMMFSSQIARIQPMVITLVAAPPAGRLREIEQSPVFDLPVVAPPAGTACQNRDLFIGEEEAERWDGLS